MLDGKIRCRKAKVIRALSISIENTFHLITSSEKACSALKKKDPLPVEAKLVYHDLFNFSSRVLLGGKNEPTTV